MNRRQRKKEWRKFQQAIWVSLPLPFDLGPHRLAKGAIAWSSWAKAYLEAAERPLEIIEKNRLEGQ